MAPPVAAVGGSAAAASGWPKGAKTTAAILAIIAVLGVIGTIVGFSQASSSDDDASAAGQDVDAANARADAAEQERDTLAEQASEAQTEIDTLNGELSEAAATNEQLSTDLSAANERADTAEAQIAEVQAQIEVAGGLLPVGIDSSLIPEDLPGNYAISFAEAYCDGFPTCGALPTQNQARIYSTPEGFLRVEVPGILDAGLFALEGSLYGITDSFTALPQCDGVDQRARVTITLFARGITIDAPEGEITRTVDTLNASITIDAPQVSAACPSGLVFYASSFTPTA